MTVGHGKTIQIYLPDGNARGVRIAEVTSRTLQAVLVPRAELDDAANRSELTGVGVYFLVGPTDDVARPQLYVGEAEDCLVRLKDHNRTKDFWTTALVVVSKTKYFTKAHGKFLEWLSIKRVQEAGRYTLENSAEPAKSYVPESVEVDLYDNFETMATLVATLGYPFFARIAKPTAREILVCKGKDASATGAYSEEGLVVFAGSRCNLQVTRTVGQTVLNRRKRLLEEGTLVEKNGVLQFTRDYPFSSPSGASDLVLGRSSNGWTEWKFENGRTLDEVKRQSDG